MELNIQSATSQTEAYLTKELRVEEASKRVLYGKYTVVRAGPLSWPSPWV